MKEILSVYSQKIIACIIFSFFATICLAQPRSKSEVESLAKNFMSYLHNRKAHPVGEENFNGKMDILHSADVIKNEEVKNMAEASEAFYIFTTNNNAGFVIVSSDKSMQPILGYSDKGVFDTDNIPENVEWWLQQYVLEHEQLAEAPKRINTLSYTGAVAPIVKTTWGQGTPYNNNCPIASGERTVTGCVATAMAQALSVYKSPNSASGVMNYSTRSLGIAISENLSNYPFDWNNILTNYVGDISYTSAQASAIANLMYACGLSVEMNYNVASQGGSGAYGDLVATALHTYFGYDSDLHLCDRSSMTEDEWKQILIEEFKAGRPVVFSGSNNYGEGHCFILDGYQTNGNEPYFHVNWGWDGYCDGYYYISNLEPEGTGIGGGTPGGGSFTNYNIAILNVKPEDGIKSLDSFWQAAQITVTPSVCKPGTRFAVTVSTVLNNSINAFSGSFEYYLIDENRNETLLGSSSIGSTTQPVQYRYGYTNYSMDFTLPTDIPYGDYTIEVRSKSTGSSREQRILSGSGIISLKVSDEETTFDADIEVTDFAITEMSGNTVSVSLSNLFNFGNTPFTGSVSLALADNNGNNFTVFGSTIDIDGLPSSSYYPMDFTINNAAIPASTPNGTYRLYLASNQSGYKNWAKVTKWVLSDGYIMGTGEEMFITVNIKNGQFVMSYELSDDEPYTGSGNEATESVTFTRTFNNTEWQALYVPFSMEYSDWADQFEVACINNVDQLDIDGDGMIDKTVVNLIKLKAGVVKANTPYLIRAKSEGEKSIKINNATLYPAEDNSITCSTMFTSFTFTGTYSGVGASAMAGNGYYAMGGGSLNLTDGSSSLKPYRWYMSTSDRNLYPMSGSTRSIIVRLIGEDDGNEVQFFDPEQVNGTETSATIYDLNGRIVNDEKLSTGAYIRNGKKILVK